MCALVVDDLTPRRRLIRETLEDEGERGRQNSAEPVLIIRNVDLNTIYLEIRGIVP